MLFRYFSLIAASLVFLTSSCTGKKEAARFHVAVEQKLGATDPLYNPASDQLQVLSLIYETLLKYAPGSANGELQPLLLKDLPQISADQLTYTFHLKDNKTFHALKNFSRTTPLNSRDVILSWLRGLVSGPASNDAILLTGLIKGLSEWKQQPPNNGAWFGRDLPSGIQVASPTEFSITLKQKYPDFLSLIALPALAVLPEEAVTQTMQFYPGSGPYYFSDTTTPDMWILRPSDEKLPIVTAVPFHDRLKAEDFDVVFPSLRLIGSLIDEQNQSKTSLRAAELRPRRMEFIVFNTSDAAIKKLGKTFRIAMSKVLSRETIINNLYRSYGATQSQFVPEGVDGHLSKMPVTNNQDPAKLHEALKNMLKTPVTVMYPQTGEFWVKEVHHELEFLGDKIKFQSADPSVYLGKISKGDYQIAPISWEAEYPEPTAYLQLFYRGKSNSQNFARFYSPSYETLFEKISRLFPSPERTQLAEKAQLQLFEEMPAIPIGYKKEIVLLNERAKNYRSQDWGFLQLKDVLSGN